MRVARNTQIHSLISLAAAVCTTFILLVFEVDLALFFGLLTFVLGYIPNIGPAVSIFLPLPMVILDPRPIAVRLIFIFIFLAATQVLSPHTPRTPHTPHTAHAHVPIHSAVYVDPAGGAEGVGSRDEHSSRNYHCGPPLLGLGVGHRRCHHLGIVLSTTPKNKQEPVGVHNRL